MAWHPASTFNCTVWGWTVWVFSGTTVQEVLCGWVHVPDAGQRSSACGYLRQRVPVRMRLRRHLPQSARDPRVVLQKERLDTTLRASSRRSGAAGKRA